MRKCHDCHAEPGELHALGCDVERCALCGGQAISCGCVYEVSRVHSEPGDEVDENGPTKAMWDLYDAEVTKVGGRLPWTGRWAGSEECEKFGWFCRFVEGSGWVRCAQTDPEAVPDLNRLVSEAWWDKQARVWKK